MPTHETAIDIDNEDRVIEPLNSSQRYATYAKATNHVYSAVRLSGEETYDEAADTRDAKDPLPATHETSSVFQRIRSWWNDGWAAEVLSCALSVIAMACLVSTLQYFDGRVLTQMPLKISINTLVAILAAAVKSSLLLPVAECISQSKWLWFSKTRQLVDFESFDLASRGPWGSFLLVFRLRTRQVVVLGAWITVLAIAIDPFSQQIIQPVVCQRTIAGAIASVPRTNNLTGVAQYAGGGMPRVLEPNIEASMLAGLLKDPGNIPVQCPTGNCTFAADSSSGASYQTLGFESACVDVTAEVELTPADGFTSAWRIPGFGDAETTVQFQSLCRTTSNLSIGTSFPDYWTQEHVKDPLFNFAAFTLSLGTNCSDFMTDDCATPLAAECRIWPAIQTIKSKIEVSELQETIVSSEPLNMYYDPDRYLLWYNWISFPPMVLRHGAWESCSPARTFSPNTPVAVSNNTLLSYIQQPVAPGDILWYADDCIWTIDIGSVSALRSKLSEMFYNQNVTSYGGGFNTAYGELWIKALYNNGHANMSTVEAYADRLARSLTIHARTYNSTADKTYGTATGIAIKTETCIKIRWAWISFPIALIALTIVFLAVTIWRTRKNKRGSREHGVWKSSSLATLFGGLGEEARHESGMVEKKSEMERRAKTLNVSLKPCENGWRLEQ